MTLRILVQAFAAVALAWPSATWAQAITPAVTVRLDSFSVRSGGLLPAARFGTNGIAIGTMDQRVVVLDSSGREIRRFGRQGSGPGEFQMIASLGVSGDTIYVLDAVRRLTALGPDDSVATELVSVTAGGPLPFNPRILAGSAVVLMQTAVPGHPIIEARGRLALRAHADGRLVDTLGALDVRDQMMRIPLLDGQSEIQLAQPFTDIDRLAVSSSGAWIAIVRTPGSRFNNDSRANAIELIGPRGRTVFNVPFRPQVLSDATVSNWLDERAAMLDSRVPGGASSARDAVAAKLVRPRSHPSVRAAAIGNDGVLWLLQSPMDAPNDRWTLVSSSGELLGSVSLPKGTRPLVVWRTGTWVVHDLPSGEQELVRYRIRN